MPLGAPPFVKFHAADRSLPAQSRASTIQPGQRLALLDAVKGIAACIIVGHHLSLYSPQSDLADEFAPALTLSLYYYGPFVVQIFLVFGGFVLALTMPDQPLSWRRAFAAFMSRYVRLAGPYLVMLALLLMVSFSALGSAMNPPLIDSFSWWQLLAHLFFLQDVLGFGNLSAGTWYLCIDMQYIALYLLVQTVSSAIAKAMQREASVAVACAACLIPLGITSSWYWNRVPENEVVVFYFLGSLVLGSLAAWAAKGKISWWICAFYALTIGASLTVEFRPRLVVALGSALLIFIAVRFSSGLRLPRPLLWLGKISYSLFLIHYVVGGLVTYGLDEWIGSSPARAFGAMVIALAASLLAATALYHGVEAPCHRRLKSLAKKRSGLPAAPSPSSPVIRVDGTLESAGVIG